MSSDRNELLRAFQSQQGPAVLPEDLPFELVELLLEEADRAVLLVEVRFDEAGRRLLTGDSSANDEESPPGVPELRLAIAETVDAHPALSWELERLSERVRTAGSTAIAGDIAAHPHILDLARLSLELFFLAHPTLESFERSVDDSLEGHPAEEAYEMRRILLASIRSRLN